MESMTVEEFKSWALYNQRQPFGAWRDNYHSAIIASILWNVNAGKNNSKSPSDFMFKTQTEKRASDTGATLAKLQAMARAS